MRIILSDTILQPVDDGRMAIFCPTSFTLNYFQDIIGTSDCQTQVVLLLRVYLFNSRASNMVFSDYNIACSVIVGFGVPLMLAYVYGVVPFSLCRNGGTCRFSNSPNSVGNSTSNLSSEDAVTNNPEDEITGMHIRNSSIAETGSLDVVPQQPLGSKTPDELLMLRMMMVLDENDVVFVNQNSGQLDGKSVTGVSARIRHRAEINHSGLVDANTSIGEFSMDSSDVHSRRNLVLLDPSGHSIVDVDSGGSMQPEAEGGISRQRMSGDEKPSFDSASTLAFHLAA